MISRRKFMVAAGLAIVTTGLFKVANSQNEELRQIVRDTRPHSKGNIFFATRDKSYFKSKYGDEAVKRIGCDFMITTEKEREILANWQIDKDPGCEFWKSKVLPLLKKK